MAISDKQRELDKIKWEKSVMLGIDACGTFDYCVMCDKSKENPCACAFNRFYNVDLGDHELVMGAPEETFEVVTDENGEAIIDDDFSIIVKEFKEWAITQEETLKQKFLGE